jgi:hypothetical protein
MRHVMNARVRRIEFQQNERYVPSAQSQPEIVTRRDMVQARRLGFDDAIDDREISMTGRRTRRDVLISAGASFCVLTVPAAWPLPGGEHTLGATDFGPLLPHLFRNPEDARAIGRAYLRGQAASPPAGRTDHDLAGLLGKPDVRSPAQLKARVADLIRQDFVNNDVVTVDGWILARTEAQICALLAA